MQIKFQLLSCNVVVDKDASFVDNNGEHLRGGGDK